MTQQKGNDTLIQLLVNFFIKNTCPSRVRAKVLLSIQLDNVIWKNISPPPAACRSEESKRKGR